MHFLCANAFYWSDSCLHFTYEYFYNWIDLEILPEGFRSGLKKNARKIIALFRYRETSVLWKESGNSKLQTQLHPEQPVFAGKRQIKKGSTGVKQKKQKCFPLGFIKWSYTTRLFLFKLFPQKR